LFSPPPPRPDGRRGRKTVERELFEPLSPGGTGETWREGLQGILRLFSPSSPVRSGGRRGEEGRGDEGLFSVPAPLLRCLTLQHEHRRDLPRPVRWPLGGGLGYPPERVGPASEASPSPNPHGSGP